MICVSVTPKSRTLAPADLLNASRQGDLIELCLDHFLKEPNVAQLIGMIDKPVLVSCRRQRDGGHWDGTEDERIQMLRNAIVAGPAYVELELDIAAAIPRFGDTRRVVSVTGHGPPPGGMDDLFEQCWKARADVVKVAWPADDLDAVWPMLAAVTSRREIPVVGAGMGRCSVAVSLLARRTGSLWAYAALERGMEAFEQQPTVFQLREDYDWDAIDSRTHFVGIIGCGPAVDAMSRRLNRAFRQLDRPIRCLPLIPGDLSRLQKRLATLSINGLIVAPGFEEDLSELLTVRDNETLPAAVDVLMLKSRGWRGRCTLMEAIHLCGSKPAASREPAALAESHSDWTQKGTVLICGHGPRAAEAARFFRKQGAAVSLSAPSDNSATGLARREGVRFVSWNSVHDLHADTLIIADQALQCGQGRGQLSASILRPPMTLVDLSEYPQESEFCREARERGARCIFPADIFTRQLQLQFRLLTGRELPAAEPPETNVGSG